MTAVGDNRFVGILGVAGDPLCCLKHHASRPAARRCARRAARRYGTPEAPVDFVVATLAEVDRARQMRALKARRMLEALVEGITGLSNSSFEGSAIVTAAATGLHPDDPVEITIEEHPA